MDFNTFSKNRAKPNTENDRNQNIAAENDVKKDGGQQKDGVEDIVNRYKGLSEAQLTEEMLKEAAKQKAGGNLDVDGLNDFAKQVMPALNPVQRKKLEEIITLLGRS